jgi:hypothetical protein
VQECCGRACSDDRFPQACWVLEIESQSAGARREFRVCVRMAAVVSKTDVGYCQRTRASVCRVVVAASKSSRALLLGSRKSGGVLCGHAMLTRYGGNFNPRPRIWLVKASVYQVSRSEGSRRNRCARPRSLVFSRRASLPVTPSRGRGCDLHSARRDVANSRDVCRSRQCARLIVVVMLWCQWHEVQ